MAAKKEAKKTDPEMVKEAPAKTEGKAESEEKEIKVEVEAGEGGGEKGEVAEEKKGAVTESKKVEETKPEEKVEAEQGEEKTEEGGEKKEEKPEETSVNEEEEKKEEAEPEKVAEEESEKKKEGDGATEKKPEEEAGGEEKKEGEKKSEDMKEEKTEDKGSEKKPRRFKLFGRKKEGAEEKNKEEEKENKEVSASEAMNQVDPDNKAEVEKKITELAEDIDEQIDEATQSDEIVIKLNRKKLVIGLGILVIVMWIVPMIRGVESLLGRSILPGGSQQEQSSEGEEAVMEEVGEVAVEEEGGEEATESAMLKVRIKYIGDNQSVAEELAGKLKEGGFGHIEVMPDEESDYEKLVVLTGEEDSKVKNMVNEVLGDSYELNQDEVGLSIEGDFDAVFFVGDGSLKE